MSVLDLDGIQNDAWNLHHLLDVLRDHLMGVCQDHRAHALIQIARDSSRTVCADIDAAVEALAKGPEASS